jgi:hypothetical protein
MELESLGFTLAHEVKGWTAITVRGLPHGRNGAATAANAAHGVHLFNHPDRHASALVAR